jgi:cold shock CspA family protein
MGRSQQSFSKREREKKKAKRKEEKAKKREERKNNPDLQADEFTYVDEFGNFHDTPPEKADKVDAEGIVRGVPPKEEGEDDDPIKTGVVTAFNDSKGFGFIREKQTQDSIFFHITDCEEEVVVNNMVTFEVEFGPKGANAKKGKVKR